MSFYEIRRMAEASCAERKQEEADHPEILDKWKEATPQIAGTAAGMLTGTATGHVAGPGVGHAVGQVTSDFVKEVVKKKGVSNTTAHDVRDAAHALDDLATILLFPIYVPAKLIVRKLANLE